MAPQAMTCHIVPDSGLRLSIPDLAKKHSSYLDPTDYHDLREYEIDNIDISHRSFNDYDISQRQFADSARIENTIAGTIRRSKSIEERTYKIGSMSPLNNVTLQKGQRKEAGIPDDAVYYAFLHPPPNLVHHFGNYKPFIKKIEDAEDKWWERPENGGTNDTVLALFALFGGFVYFDDSLDPRKAKVNVMTATFKTNFQIILAGPYKTSKVALQGVSNRARPLILPTLFECGWISLSWVRPNETFQGHSISNDDKAGCFVFYKCDGSSAAYAVQSDPRYRREHGGFNFIPDAYESLLSLANDGICSVENFVKLDFKECRRNVKVALMQTWQKPLETTTGRPSFFHDSSIYIPELDKGGSVLHQAIKGRCDVATIKMILKKFSDELGVSAQKVLAETDPTRWSWNSLHYMCRYHSDNIDIFDYAIELLKPTTYKLDVFGRTPLHVACNKNSCVKVIKLLLDSCGNDMVVAETKYLKLLPLHFALINGASKEVIKLLLAADERGISVSAMTRTGRNALHIAIMTSASYEIIELLLETDNARDLSKEVRRSISRDNRHLARLQKHHGLSPLHMACLKCLDLSIITLLLDEDHTYNDIFDTIANSGPGPRDTNVAEMMSMNRPGIESPFIAPAFLASIATAGSRALHISLKMKSIDTTMLLLQIEKQQMYRTAKGGADVQTRATMVDADGRTCLHLACMNNEELETIDLLLLLDPRKESMIMLDKDNMTPLQLACDHATARKDVINTLLKAQCKRKPENKVLSGKRPLLLALKAGAPSDVLELLMHPRYFSLTEFDFNSSMIKLLSTRVKKSKGLQDIVNKRLAAHIPFAFLSFQLAANIMVLIAFAYGLESHLDNKECDHWVKAALVTLATNFAFYEIIQVLSTPWNYAASILENCANWTHISLIYVSSEILASKPAQDSSLSRTLVAGLVFTVFNLIFSLRRTFLPFCYLLGGIFHFMNMLIPFAVITVLFLVMFAYIFMATSNAMMNDTTSVTTMKSMTLARGLEEEQNSCTNGGNSATCFFYLWSSFAGTRADDNVGILFGLVVSIVLFNIGIAIVDSAWQHAKDKGQDFFWHGRLVYLQEIRYIEVYVQKIVSFISPTTLDFDAILEKEIINTYFSLEEINWKEEPYNAVKEKKHYIDPHDYFNTELANKILNARSIRSDLYWYSGHKKLIVVLKCLLFGLLNILLIPLGIMSFGILCPIRHRLWVLSYAVEEDEDVHMDKCYRPSQSSISNVPVPDRDFNSPSYLDLVQMDSQKTRKTLDLLMDRFEEALLEKSKIDEQKKDALGNKIENTKSA